MPDRGTISSSFSAATKESRHARLSSCGFHSSHDVVRHIKEAERALARHKREWAKFSMRSNLAAASNLTGHYERLTATMTNIADTSAGVALAKLRDTFVAKLAAEDVYTSRDAVAMFQAIHGLDEQDKDAMLAMMFAQTVSIGLAQ